MTFKIINHLLFNRIECLFLPLYSLADLLLLLPMKAKQALVAVVPIAQ